MLGVQPVWSVCPVLFLFQTSMHYYSALNALQYKRRVSLLEPLVGYVYAQRAFFEMGKDATGKTEIEQFLSNINASIQAYV